MLCSLAVFPPPVSQLTIRVLTTRSLFKRHYRERLYGRTPDATLMVGEYKHVSHDTISSEKIEPIERCRRVWPILRKTCYTV